MGETIDLTAADGHHLGAYTSGDPAAAVGLVVIQEIFGVNHHIRSVCDRFAAAGYRVIAPALFDRAERGVELGYTQDDVQLGIKLRAGVPEAGMLTDIDAAARWLDGRRKGVIGYCWGGTLAWLSATRLTRFAAAVGWYGGGIAAAKGEQPRCPVQLHFGDQDHSIPIADVEAIRQSHPGVTVFVYPGAGHGFGCDERASYSKPDAALAQQRTLAFFTANLAPAAAV
jgi:carboxymethylenebutenolidase